MIFSHHRTPQQGQVPTFLGNLGIVGPLSETAHVFLETNARLELRFQDVALVEEKHKVDLGKELVGADLLPQENAILLYNRRQNGGGTRVGDEVYVPDD